MRGLSRGGPVLVLLVAVLTVVVSLHQPPSTHTNNLDPCPHGCRCISRGGNADRHRWHRLLAAYRTRRIVYGDRGSSAPAWSPRPDHKHQTKQQHHGREMTCLGLSNMPDLIPQDVNKMTIYGDSKTYSQQPQDSPNGGRVGYPNNDDRGDSRLTKNYHQLTAISKYSFRANRGIAELSIEGNRIKVIHPNDFDMLSDMKRLTLRNNRLKLIWVKGFRGLDKLETLDLSRNHLRRLPKSVFYDLPGVKSLYLNKNRLRGLHTKMFRKMKHLELLDVSDNYLKALHQDMFVHNVHLKELVADNNNIIHIRADWFANTPKLTKISFRGNRITELTPKLFHGVPNLKHIHLDRNEITYIPREVFSEATHLHVLSIVKNNISGFAEGAFTNAGNLRHLDLSENRISKLENESFAGLESLDRLSLSKNQLLGMQKETFKQTKHLTHIDLSYNKIKTIKTRNFYGLLELRELKLDHNEIKVIEEEGFAVSLVNTYSKVTWLYLHFNQLGQVTSRMFYGLSYLKFLNLCHNNIGSIDEGGLSMTGRLHTLIMNDNRLDRIELGTFKHLKHVRHLNMGSNNLHDLAFNVFEGLDHLEDLNLQSNPIHDIPVGTFQGTPHLITLNLKKNKLRSFDLEVMETATRLKYLDLSRNALSKLRMPDSFQGNLYFLSLADNNLRTLQPEVTQTLTRGASLHLYGNPWSCDCTLDWLKGVYVSSRYKLPENDEIVCKSPKQLSGEQVLSLRPEDLQCLSRDQVTLRHHDAPSVSCSFLGHAKHSNTRKHVKARKDDLLDWYATFLHPNRSLHCAGVLMSREWVLAPSACWKFYTDAPLILRVGHQGAASDNIAREVIIDQVVHYPGSLDIAMIKFFAATDAVMERNFPCVLSEKGAMQALRKHTHGILQTRRTSLRHEDRMTVRPYPFQVVDSPSTGTKSIRVSGRRTRMPVEPGDMRDAPYFVKVGISRWAFVGFNGRRPSTTTDTMVAATFPAIRWIDRLLY